MNEHKKAEYTADLDRFRAARIEREQAKADTPPPPDEPTRPAPPPPTPKHNRMRDWIKQRRPAADYTNGELIGTYRFMNDSYLCILSKKFNGSGKPYDTSGLAENTS